MNLDEGWMETEQVGKATCKMTMTSGSVNFVTVAAWKCLLFKKYFLINPLKPSKHFVGLMKHFIKTL